MLVALALGRYKLPHFIATTKPSEYPPQVLVKQNNYFKVYPNGQVCNQLAHKQKNTSSFPLFAPSVAHQTLRNCLTCTHTTIHHKTRLVMYITCPH